MRDLAWRRPYGSLLVSLQVDQPRHVDAIVSFNGSNEGTREADAVSLAEKGYASVLLFSQGGAVADTACPKVSRVSVVCFVDVTGHTRGEAEWVGRYAQRHHWHSLLLVPGRGQATRALLLTERCFSGQLVVVPADESRPPLFPGHSRVGWSFRCFRHPPRLLNYTSVRISIQWVALRNHDRRQAKRWQAIPASCQKKDRAPLRSRVDSGRTPADGSIPRSTPPIQADLDQGVRGVLSAGRCSCSGRHERLLVSRRPFRAR